jgi:hypothetical protein
MRALGNHPGANREIFLALVAALACRNPVAKAAYLACRTIGPKPRFKVNPRRFLVREHFEELEGRYRAFGQGGTPLGVRYIIPFHWHWRDAGCGDAVGDGEEAITRLAPPDRLGE